MRPIAKITCAAFQVIILAIGTPTADSEPGDLFASIDGDPGNGADSAGKLFVAQIPPSAGGDILKFTRKGVPTVFASEIGVPQENGGPEYFAIQPVRP